MKIKLIKKTYKEVSLMPSPKRQKPKKQWFILSTLVRLICIPTYLSTRFKITKINMDKLNKKQSYLILMNHSSFTDMKLIFKMLYPRKFNIIATEDALVNQEWLLRRLGCIPTKKFVTDPSLVKDMLYVIKNFKCPIVMYPEAGYSFDGTSTTLPNTLGKLMKLLKIPVVFINTSGAFLRDPLYNNLQIRKVKLHATMDYAISVEDIQNKSIEELNNIVYKYFNFDAFKEQQEKKIEISESFRADKINRILYRCSSCGKEGFMIGKGIHLTCTKCNKTHELTKYGSLKALDGKETFTHIPDWMNYQREEVKKEILNGTYNLDTDVDIYIIKNYKSVYHIGTGHLNHSIDGFHLVDESKLLNYHHKPDFSYTINSDFNWYEIGDVICIGEKDLYYLIPRDQKDIVCKTRLAAEEIYKLVKKN